MSIRVVTAKNVKSILKKVLIGISDGWKFKSPVPMIAMTY